MPPPVRADFLFPERLHHVDYLQQHPVSSFRFGDWFCNDATLRRVVEYNRDTTEVAVRNGRETLSEDGIALLAELPKLQVIDIPDCPGFTEASVRLIIKCVPGLVQLNLSNCELVDDAVVAQLALNARQLRQLSLRNCTRVSDMGFKTFGERPPHYQTIADLDLSGCSRLTDKGLLALLRGTRGLAKLALAGLRQLTDLGLMGFTSATGSGTNPALRELDLSGTLVDASGFAWLASGVPDLEVLRLADCEKVGSHVLELLGEHVHGLVELDLTNCAGVMDRGIIGLGPQPELDKLVLTNCAELTDAAFEALAVNAPRLRYLSTAGLNRVSDGCLVAVGAKLRLEYFNFGGAAANANVGVRSFYGAPRISDMGARSFVVGGGAQLRYLSLAGLTRLKDPSVGELAKHCPHLVSLILNGCTGITDKPFKELFKR
jgi:hypothetical protein